jgi:hypothetical protein
MQPTDIGTLASRCGQSVPGCRSICDRNPDTHPQPLLSTGRGGSVSFAGQVPQIAGYAGLGLFTTERLLLSALMIPPVAVGFAIGTAVRSWMSQRAFALVVRLALLVIGLRLVFEALR